MKAPHWFLVLAGVLAVSAVALWFIRPGVPKKSQDKPQAPALMPTSAEPTPSAEPIAPDVPPTQTAIVASDANPAELIKRIATALESGDVSVLEKLLGDSRLDDASRGALRSLLASKPRLAQGGGIREVGELELN